jgi:hypothetical protein
MDEQPPTSGLTPATEPLFPDSAPIQARVIFGEVTYFALTQEQIDTHTALGWLATVFISLAGLALEAALGAWLAITQGANTPASSATLTTIMWTTVIAGAVLAIAAGIFIILKTKTRRGWLTNTLRLDRTAT